MEILDITMSLLALIVLEIILGIDNLVFLSILTMKLPLAQRRKARRWGLMFAWMMRLMMLAGALALSKLTTPLIAIDSLSFSARDIFLFFLDIVIIYIRYSIIIIIYYYYHYYDIILMIACYHDSTAKHRIMNHAHCFFY